MIFFKNNLYDTMIKIDIVQIIHNSSVEIDEAMKYSFVSDAAKG